MTELFINTATKKMLDQLTSADLPQGLLLTGEPGIGLGTIAAWIGKQKKALVTVITPEKNEVVNYQDGTISIQQVRPLYERVRAKYEQPQLFIIDDADRMTVQAQNAFLKLLEEPQPRIYFLLTSHHPSILLGTIRSRVQEIPIRRIDDTASRALLDDLRIHDTTQRAQLLFIAEGRPAELHRLAKDTAYFEAQATLIRDARTLLQGAPYDKLLLAHRYRDNRQDAISLVHYAGKLVRASLVDNPSVDKAQRLDRLVEIVEQLAANANIRLALARFVVQ